MTPSAKSKSPDVRVNGQVMDPEGCAIRACFDPGHFTPRRSQQRSTGGSTWYESLHRWQARAVLVALGVAGHEITPAPDARATPERWHD